MRGSHVRNTSDQHQPRPLAHQGKMRMLLEKAEASLLPKHELDQVVAGIKILGPGGPISCCSYIIGRAVHASNESLVASYLDCRQGPMLSRLA